MAREIDDANPDEGSQFEDRISGFGTRDATGLPLGDVLGHSLNRLVVCYGVLEAADLAADYAQIAGGDGIPPNFDFFAVGASPQDRQGSNEYPAAHLVPCSLEVGNPKSTKARPKLYELYADGINRSFVRDLFRRTELVHVLTNRADSRCEGTARKDKDGMAHVLARSCETVVRDPKLSAKDVFFDKLVPEFQAVAQRQLIEFNEKLLARFPDALSPQVSIVDQYGKPIRSNWDPLRMDARIHSSSPAAWKANRQAISQILSTYATTRAMQSDIARMSEQFRALKANEEREAVNRMRKR